MDDAAVGLATSVWHSDHDTARRWFDLVCQEYQGLEDDVQPDQLRQAIVDAADRESFDPDVPSAFLEYAEATGSDLVGLVAQWVEATADGVLQVYVDAFESAMAASEAPVGHEAPAEPVVAEETFDPDAWAAHLASWDGDWDGTDESWPAFTQYFTYYAPEGAKGAAADLIAYVEAQEDKVAALAAYGIGVAGALDRAESEADEQPETETDEPEAAAPADPAEVTTELIDEIAMPVMELFLAQNPEYADLPPERLVELLSEVLVEQLDQQLTDA